LFVADELDGGGERVGERVGHEQCRLCGERVCDRDGTQLLRALPVRCLAGGPSGIGALGHGGDRLAAQGQVCRRIGFERVGD